MVYLFDKWDKPQIKENQVIVVNIHWNTKTTIHYRNKNYTYNEVPEMVIVDIPTNIYQMKRGQSQDDAIESFVYSQLSNFFNHEILSCQIFKYCEEDSWMNYEDFDGPGSHKLLENVEELYPTEYFDSTDNDYDYVDEKEEENYL